MLDLLIATMTGHLTKIFAWADGIFFPFFGYFRSEFVSKKINSSPPIWQGKYKIFSGSSAVPKIPLLKAHAFGGCRQAREEKRHIWPTTQTRAMSVCLATLLPLPCSLVPLPPQFPPLCDKRAAAGLHYLVLSGAAPVLRSNAKA